MKKKHAKKLLDQTIKLRDPKSGQIKSFSAKVIVDGIRDLCLSESTRVIAYAHSSALVAQLPELVESHEALASVLLNCNGHKEAINCIASALNSGFNTPTLYTLLSAAYRESGQINLALSCLEKATAIYPRSSQLIKEKKVCEKIVSIDNNTEISAAIVTTLIDCEDIIESYVNYHLDIGFERIFLFFDDPNDPSIEKVINNPKVQVIRHDELLEKQWLEHRNYPVIFGDKDKEVMTRQMLNVLIANDLCLEQNIDWLLHIDCDELFHTRNQSVKEHFKDLSKKGIRYASYCNYEGLPSEVEADDYFKKVTVFKRNVNEGLGFSLEKKEMLKKIPQFARDFFLFYGNGKSAAQVSKNLTPSGVHRFKVDDPIRTSQFHINHTAIILHYACCGFKHFLKKYQTLGQFDDKWFGTFAIADSVPFHIEARDVVGKADLTVARQFFADRVVLSDKKLLADLDEAEIIEKISKPSEILNMMENSN